MWSIQYHMRKFASPICLWPNACFINSFSSWVTQSFFPKGLRPRFQFWPQLQGEQGPGPLLPSLIVFLVMGVRASLPFICLLFLAVILRIGSPLPLARSPLGCCRYLVPPPLAPPSGQRLLLPSHLVQLLEVSGESLTEHRKTHPGLCKDALEGCEWRGIWK